MNKTSLAKTNPYLKDPLARAKAVARTVATSSAIEGISVRISAEKQQGKIVFTIKPQ